MKRKETKITLHSARNLLGEPSQIDLFSNQAETFAERYSFTLSGKIDRFGVDLTDMQSRVMEGILRGLSESKYSRNLTHVESHVLCEEKYNGKVPPGYKNVKSIPILKTSQSQILEWAGINKNSIATWSRAVEAIDELGSKQFCFYYNRLVFDEQRKPVKDKYGRWVKEEVYTVDTLFTIKKITKNDKLDYYEIYPSAIFLDQQDTYFMFIPYDWREEVRTLVGAKKSSSYTFRFLFWLRYQNEMFRRKKKPLPYVIKMPSEEVAISIKMPESVYKRKTKATNKILIDAYEVALKLGYLLHYERNDVDVLTLNDKKFFFQTDLEIPDSITEATLADDSHSAQELMLLNLFHEIRAQQDKHHKKPDGSQFQKQLEEIKILLQERPAQDVERAIRWALNKNYWAPHTTTPSDLRKNFVKIWADISTSNQSSKEQRQISNKEYAEKHLLKFEDKPLKNDVFVAVLSKHIEIGMGVHVDILSYDEVQFHERLCEILKKWQILHVLDPQTS